jgi:hypothetical protein
LLHLRKGIRMQWPKATKTAYDFCRRYLTGDVTEIPRFFS